MASVTGSTIAARRAPVRRGVSLLVASCACAFAVPAAAVIAAPAPGRRVHHRPTHHTHVCHRSRHRRCRAEKPHHKLRRSSASEPSAPNGLSTGSSSGGASSAPWTAPAPVIPGATPGSGGGSSPSPGGAPVAEAPTAPAGPAHVQVTAEDGGGYHFILSRTTAPAGEVILEFVNHGQDEHNLHAVEPVAGSEAGGLKENTLPGARTDLTLDLRAGSYTLFCSLPGHEAKGMKATLTVD